MPDQARLELDEHGGNRLAYNLRLRFHRRYRLNVCPYCRAPLINENGEKTDGNDPTARCGLIPNGGTKVTGCMRCKTPEALDAFISRAHISNITG